MAKRRTNRNETEVGDSAKAQANRTPQSKRSQGLLTPRGTSFAQRMAILKGNESANSFATHLGMSAGQLSKYLDGSLPGMEVLHRIIQATGCDPAWLVTGSGEPFPKVSPESPEGQARLDAACNHLLNALYEIDYSLQAVIPLLGDEQANSVRKRLDSMRENLGQ